MKLSRIMMPYTTNVCEENDASEKQESKHGSSDGEMEIDDANKMQAFGSDAATVVSETTAAMGMFHN